MEYGDAKGLNSVEILYNLQCEYNTQELKDNTIEENNLVELPYNHQTEARVFNRYIILVKTRPTQFFLTRLYLGIYYYYYYYKLQYQQLTI